MAAAAAHTLDPRAPGKEDDRGGAPLGLGIGGASGQDVVLCLLRCETCRRELPAGRVRERRRMPLARLRAARGGSRSTAPATALAMGRRGGWRRLNAGPAGLGGGRTGGAWEGEREYSGRWVCASAGLQAEANEVGEVGSGGWLGKGGRLVGD